MLRTNSPLLPVLWSGLNRLQDEMDWLFGRLGNEAPRLVGPVFPLLNIWEASDAFHLGAELPGVNGGAWHGDVTHRRGVRIGGGGRAGGGGGGRGLGRGPTLGDSGPPRPQPLPPAVLLGLPLA